MNRNKKRILFIILAILFLITSTATILYSFGWRFDWKTKKITQPGIFYFKILPKNARIYLNGRLKKKTDFFFGSALIDNVLPGQYDIEIKKQGFYSWQKTLEIKKRQVTEAKSIVLIPKNPKFTEISTHIKNAFFSPDGRKIILQETTATASDNSKQTLNKNWSLKLFEIDKNLKSQLIEGKNFLPKTKKVRGKKTENVQLADLKFSFDSKRILLKVKFKKNIKYYLLDINNPTESLIPLNFSKQNIEEIYFDPEAPTKIFILSSSTAEAKTNKKTKTLSKIDLNNKNIIFPVLNNITACFINQNGVYYLDDSGFLFKTDFSFKNKEKLNLKPLSSKTKKENCKIKAFKSYLILKQGNALYLLEKNKPLQKISNSVKDFKFSLDGKKIAYFDDHEIQILFLEKNYSQPLREKGEQLFLTRFLKKIDNLFWWTNDYLIFNTGNKIKIAEIDNRDKINIVELVSFKDPQIFWNQKNSKLYVLSKGSLFSSEKLLP